MLITSKLLIYQFQFNSKELYWHEKTYVYIAKASVKKIKNSWKWGTYMQLEGVQYCVNRAMSRCAVIYSTGYEAFRNK